MREFFQRRGKFRPQPSNDELGETPALEELWVKCPGCGDLLYAKELEHNNQVCPKCDHHFRLRARQRIALLTGENGFEEWDADLRPADPLGFTDASGPYAKKLDQARQKSGETESLIAGQGSIDGFPAAILVTDFGFLGASMGSVFGEKFARAVERAIERRLPLLTVSASGGARMQEGLFSLMQMAKTVAALSRLGRAKLPHIALLTDPCLGGVTASYATVADVIVAEPGAMIGFAGPRVIEQITRQKLPAGFQTSEFLLQHGMIDLITPRDALQAQLVKLLSLYANLEPTISPVEPERLLAAVGVTND